MAATLLGFVIGTLCAIGRDAAIGWLARACGVYVEVIRNTPLLVQIFLVYFGLSQPRRASCRPSSRRCWRWSINVGAYTTEIMRAGIESVIHRPDRGRRMPGAVARRRSTGT